MLFVVYWESQVKRKASARFLNHDKQPRACENLMMSKSAYGFSVWDEEGERAWKNLKTLLNPPNSCSHLHASCLLVARASLLVARAVLASLVVASCY